MQPLRWFRRRRSSDRARERLFVVRWGELEPELYLVGEGIRRLAIPPGGLALARQMLAEVMYCQPALQLARAFADAHLEPVPADGFVLSTADVEAWLDRRT
jgi:hypothetical protein